MKQKLLSIALTGFFVIGILEMATAASFTFDGNITYHNDVVQIEFTLDTAATDVKVWTDYFMAPTVSDPGTNFDPITAVWVFYTYPINTEKHE